MRPVTVTSVRIVRPIGETTIARATADQFEPHVLTITAVEDDSVIETLQPDQWIECAVYHEGDDYPIFTFCNDRAWQGHVESRNRRSA